MTTGFDDAVRSPLSPTQRDFLLDAAALADTSHHALASSIELPADIELARWERAATDVFRAEPAMRLRLHTAGGEVWQALDPDAALTTTVQ
jgi:hypothetical protein